MNTLCGQNVEFVNVKPGGTYVWIQSVPRSKHKVSVIKSSQLMLCREILAVCSEIHTKHINTVCGQDVEFVNVKPGGTYVWIQSVPRSKHKVSVIKPVS